MTGRQSAPRASTATSKLFSAHNSLHATNITANALARLGSGAKIVRSQYVGLWPWAKTGHLGKVQNVYVKKVGRE